MSPLTNLREYAHFDNNSIIAVWNGNSVRASFIVVTPVNHLKLTGRESEPVIKGHSFPIPVINTTPTKITAILLKFY